MLATPLSAALMTLQSPWVPYIVGLLIIFIAALFVLLLPETLDQSCEDPSTRPTDEDASRRKTAVQEMHGKALEFFHSTRFIWRNPNIILALLMFLTTSLSRQATNLLLQYSSTKFHWTIARASFLLSIRGSVTLFNFLIVMPTLSTLLMRRLHMSSMWKDRRMCQASGLIGILGFALMFLAASPAAYVAGLVFVSLGAAFIINARSLVAFLVTPHQIGTLYSATAMVQSLGSLVGGPVFARLFQWGLNLGWAWLGLPFLLPGLLYAVATTAVWNMSMPEEASDDERRALI